MSESKRLKVVALAYVEQGYFDTFDQAFAKISSDFSKGYPSPAWLDSFEKFEKLPGGVTVTLDEENNYGCYGVVTKADA